MKKISLFFAVLFIGFAVQSNAQNCTPDHTGYTSVPDTGILLPRPLPNATVNVAYQQVITIGVPDTVKSMGFGVPMNWLKLDSVKSSLGNTWVVVNSTGETTFPQWDKSTWQCVTMTGTPTHVGMDSITVYVDGEVAPMGLPTTLTGQPGGKLPLLVQEAQAIGAEYMDDNVSVFPNPSADGHFSLTVDQQFEMTVCDITGRIVTSETIAEGVYNLDLANEPAGVYFARLKNDNYSKVMRIVKK